MASFQMKLFQKALCRPTLTLTNRRDLVNDSCLLVASSWDLLAFSAQNLPISSR